MKKIAMICVTILFVAVSAHGTVYTNKANWDTAVSGLNVLTEDFSAEPFADFTIQSDFEDTNPTYVGISVIHPTYGDFTGEWYDMVDDEAGTETTISFNQTIYGFGGEWDLAGPTNPGEGLELWVGGSIVATIDRNTAGTFVGIANIGAFNNLVIRGWDQVSGVETFALDNAVYAVPVPGAVLLGMLGLSVAGIKLRKSV